MTATTDTNDKYLFQCFVAFCATLVQLSGGVAMGWPSPTLPKLTASDSPIPITSDDASWIVAILAVGQIISIFPVYWMMDRFGRKATILAGTLPLLLSWILVGTANNIAMLYSARVLVGISMGITFMVLPYYLGEIASVKIRGFITTLLMVMWKIGILYSFLIAPYVSVYTMAWIGIIPPSIFVILFIWMPESPYFLIGKGNVDNAFKSLVKLRGHQHVQDELKRIQEAVQKSSMEKGTFKELFSKHGGRQSLLIMFAFCAIQNLCGAQVVISYSETIFNRIDTGLSGSEASIMLGIVQLMAASVACVIVDIVGRKILLLVSLSGLIMTTSIVGVYFALERNGSDVQHIGWLPVVALLLFVASFNIGLASIPFAISGEIFLKHLKALASCCITVSTTAIIFAVNKLFQVISDSAGNDIPFWIFCCSSFLFIPFVLFSVPETKGKQFDVILNELTTKGIFSHYTKKCNC